MNNNDECLDVLFTISLQVDISYMVVIPFDFFHVILC